MVSYTMVGYPFDPSLDAYWVELSNSLRMNKKEKQALKFNYCQGDRVELANYLVKGTQDALINAADYYGFSCAPRDSDFDAVSEQTRNLFNYVMTKPQKLANRCIVFCNPYYHDLVRQQAANTGHGNADWVIQRMKRLTMECSDRLASEPSFKEALESVGSAFAAKLQALKTDKYDPADFFQKRLELGKGIDLEIDYAILYALYKLSAGEVTVAQGLLDVWVFSYVCRDDILFAMACIINEDKIDYGHFPFINQYFITYLKRVISESENAATVPHDVELVFRKHVKAVTAIAEKSSASYVERCAEVFSEVDSWNKSELIRTLYVKRKADFEDIIKLLEVDAPEVFEEREVFPFPDVTKSAEPELALSFLAKVGASVEYLKRKHSILGFSDEEQGIADSLSDIQKQAIELGKNPLANIDKLNELWLEMGKLQEKHAEFDQARKVYISGIDTEIGAVYKSFDKWEQDLAATDTGQVYSESDMQLVLAKLERANDQKSALESDLLQTHEEIEQLKDKLFAAKQVPVTVNPTQSAVQPVNALAMVADALASNFNLEALLRMTEEAGAGRIKFSKTAMQSAKSIKNFERLDVLADMLAKLSSPEFMKAYLSKGSNGAFQFFTKKVLSFQESETTKLSTSISRDFAFDDAVRECRAHLRLGVDNTEQNMLRVYFCIEDGVVYVGEVTRHLPVGTKVS